MTYIKRLFLAISAIISVWPQSSLATYDQFCAGFQHGYATGYKQAKQTTIEPLAPTCPLQPLRGFGDPESDWEFGYTIGYKKGLTAGQGY